MKIKIGYGASLLYGNYYVGFVIFSDLKIPYVVGEAGISKAKALELAQDEAFYRARQLLESSSNKWEVEITQQLTGFPLAHYDNGPFCMCTERKYVIYTCPLICGKCDLIIQNCNCDEHKNYPK